MVLKSGYAVAKFMAKKTWLLTLLQRKMQDVAVTVTMAIVRIMTAEEKDLKKERNNCNLLN